MEVNFKKQLAERLEFVNSLLKEMKEKEKEFEEYCRQAEIDREFLMNFCNNIDFPQNHDILDNFSNHPYLFFIEN